MKSHLNSECIWPKNSQTSTKTIDSGSEWWLPNEEKILKYKIINNDEQINVESQQFGALPKVIPCTQAKSWRERSRLTRHQLLQTFGHLDVWYALCSIWFITIAKLSPGVGTMRANDWAKISPHIRTRFRIINVQYTSVYLFLLNVFDRRARIKITKLDFENKITTPIILDNLFKLLFMETFCPIFIRAKWTEKIRCIFNI